MEPNLANGGDGSDGDFDYEEDGHSQGCITYVYKADYLPTTRRGIPLEIVRTMVSATQFLRMALVHAHRCSPFLR